MNPVDWGHTDQGYFIIIDTELLKSQETYRTSDGMTYYTMEIPLDDINKPLGVGIIQEDYEFELTDNVLMGYLRRSNTGGSIRISLNEDTLESVQQVVGEKDIALHVYSITLKKILNGERAVATVNFAGDKVINISEKILLINWMDVNPFDTKD